MSQWGQQQGYQYPMHTGHPGAIPPSQQSVQFQQQNPSFQPQQGPVFQQQQGPQFQQNPPFQQGGFMPQMTGIPSQRPQGLQGSAGPAFIQSQPTGFPAAGFQQANRSIPQASTVPPVPQIPLQFQQYTSGNNFLNPSSQQQAPNRFLSASPGLGQALMSQPSGFAGRVTGQSLLPQMTGFVDPRLQMMTNTFMPINTAAPYNPAGIPQLAPQQNLQQSFQQHNEAQRGTANQQLSWEPSKAEKKKYNDLFRTWDSGNTGFIDGQTALEVFGVSGLPKEDLARIWTLADIDDRGKLNIAEFHIAMGLIYRRLNGMPIPERLPPELIPPSARDLDSSVEVLKDILKHETGSRSRSPLGADSPVSRQKVRTFNGTSSLESGRDATIYKHTDAEPPGGFYKPAARHIKRDDVRSRSETNSPAGDLSYIKKQLANTAKKLDQAAEAEASRTAEDEELDREMEDLKYRVKRMQDDLDYVSRGPRSTAKDEERRRIERELLSLMHEHIPEVERRMKARDERKEREKRQWARDRDRMNAKFGRFDSRDEAHSDRPGDQDRSYSRGGYSEDRSFHDRPISPADERIQRYSDYERSSSPVVRAISPPAKPQGVSAGDSHSVSAPKGSPSPAPMKNMTPKERQNYARAEAQRRIQARMAALGVTALSSPSVDATVEDRLQQEKKEAEEKARLAEKQAEERERLRKERLEQEKAAKEAKIVSSSSIATPLSTQPATSQVSILPQSGAPRAAAPPPPKPRAPAPPPPRKAPAPIPSRSSAPPTVNEVDPVESELRAREEVSRKQREEQARRLKLLEEEEEAARLEEQRYQARLQALKTKQLKQDSSAASSLNEDKNSAASAKTESPVTLDDENAPSPVVSPPTTAKSTNPFSRMMKGSGGDPTTTEAVSSNTNPWSRASVPSDTSAPSLSTKGSYQTAPSNNEGDWDDAKEIDDDSDSSDEEMRNSRDVRANIAQQLFGNMLPRPASASTMLDKSPSSPSPSTSLGSSLPPPPPPPPPPPAPRQQVTMSSSPAFDSLKEGSTSPTTISGPGDVSALLRSIQGGMKLRPAQTIDKSAPGITGRVLGDDALPPHISSATITKVTVPEISLPKSGNTSKSNNRQSVDWVASRAADTGTQDSLASAISGRLPSTLEDEQEGMPEVPEIVPEIQIHDAGSSDMKDDVDRSIEYRVRTIYAFEGQGSDDLSFDENVVVVANPSKSGSDWWYGTTVKDGRAGLFPKTYIQVAEPKRARAIYGYTASNRDELSFSEGTELSILDISETEWWRAEDAGIVFLVPAAYLEIIEDSEILYPDGTQAADTVHVAETPDSDYSEDSHYLSFEESEDEDDRVARERERRLVLEAAGLVVRNGVHSHHKINTNVQWSPSSTEDQQLNITKRLPPLPPPEDGTDHQRDLDDAFARYETFKKSHQNSNRLSIISSESSTHESPLVHPRSFLHRYKLHKMPDSEKKNIQISAPIIKTDFLSSVDIQSRSTFGFSWTSLVDESVLNDIPLKERLRQEAIFELITTEVAYVHDLQLIVEIFYAMMLPLLSSQETTVIFANIEDILLINTTFLSALEEHQKNCRLYIDEIGDILEAHFPNMGVYIEYCTNHSNAIKVLQSLRQKNPELSKRLQEIQNLESAVRNLDLSSYLLSPMQRITRYPLLLRQILSYSDQPNESKAILHALNLAEELLQNINETIKFQEGQEVLKHLSHNLWIGQGHLDLTAPTKYMDSRKLIKEGILLKRKSGRKLHAFLCSDILILTDESVKHLYKMPIPLIYYSIKELSKDNFCFQLYKKSAPKIDYITLKALSLHEYELWIQLIQKTSIICINKEKQYNGIY